MTKYRTSSHLKSHIGLSMVVKLQTFGCYFKICENIIKTDVSFISIATLKRINKTPPKFEGVSIILNS